MAAVKKADTQAERVPADHLQQHQALTRHLACPLPHFLFFLLPQTRPRQPTTHFLMPAGGRHRIVPAVCGNLDTSDAATYFLFYNI